MSGQYPGAAKDHMIGAKKDNALPAATSKNPLAAFFGFRRAFWIETSRCTKLKFCFPNTQIMIFVRFLIGNNAI